MDKTWYNVDMKKNIPTEQPIEDTQQARYRVYKNGAVFDREQGRIVAMKPELATQPTQITRENTGEYLAKRRERKEQLLAEAANEAVENMTLKNLHGSDAWIAEIGGAMQRKATNIDDPKMVDAARFLLQETGLSSKQAEQAQNTLPSDETLRQLAGFAATLISSVGADMVSYRKHEVIDADVQDANTDDASTD